ncbi:MAG TPA: hypothetical protein VGM77_02925 [Gemmatimonadales bacterium]|jgi:hypothetical protein
MWPRFESPAGEQLTVAQVVERGNSAIKAPAGLAIAAIALSSLIVAAIVRSHVMAEPDSWHRFLPALLMFACLGFAFGIAWAWHAVTVPRWWDWAVATGVDTDELIAAASQAGLISRREAWWQERPSTLHARRRHRSNQAL